MSVAYLTALDHIIIGVSDLQQAEQRFRHSLGLLPSGGGIHPSGGTANRVIIIGDTYLELITVREPDEAQPSLLSRLARGDGYLNFVLASDDIESACSAMRQRGIPIIGPTPGQLTSPDGRSRGWMRADIERPDLAQRYPFLIQHDSQGAERRFRLAGWTTPPAHPLGAVQVRSATIAVADLAEATRRFQHIYDLEPSPPYTGAVDGWEAMLVAFPLKPAGQSFELAESLPLSDEPTTAAAPGSGPALLPQPGELARHLAIYGESLCRITIAVQNLAAARNHLDANNVTYTYQEAPHSTLWIAPHESCSATLVLHELVQ